MRPTTVDKKKQFIEHLPCQSPLMYECSQLIASQYYRVDVTVPIFSGEETKDNENDVIHTGLESWHSRTRLTSLYHSSLNEV